MLVKKNILESDVRSYLVDSVDDVLECEEGHDLQSVIREVLNDKDIFTFLAMHSERATGLRLGVVQYFDDAIIYTHYGLALDFDEIPRRTRLFSYESFDELGLEQKNVWLGASIGVRVDSDPSPQLFIDQVNNVLRNPRPYLVRLNLDKVKGKF